MAVAVQADRMSHADLKGYCLLKLHDPGFRVTERIALDGAQPVDEPPWTLGRVLQRLDLQLATLEFESVSEPDRREVRSGPTEVRRPVGAAA